MKVKILDSENIIGFPMEVKISSDYREGIRDHSAHDYTRISITDEDSYTEVVLSRNGVLELISALVDSL